MTDEKFIRIGFFEDFKGEDSVLIDTGIHGLMEIEAIFSRLSKKKQMIHSENFKFLDKEHFLRIQLTSGEINQGLRMKDSEYEWILTPKKWNELKEMTTVLYKNGTGGHQYLDSDSKLLDDLQVVLSFNEYGIGFWKKH